MRMWNRVALTAALLVPTVAAPAAAQNWRWDIGVNGGYSWYSGLLGSEDTGLPDGTDRDDVKFEAGWLTGAQLTFWLTPKLGLRANGTYTERPVVAENYDLLDGGTENDNWFEDVNLWSGSADLLFRLRSPNTEWQGSEFLPYLALGFGRKWVNPAEDAIQCIDAPANDMWSCYPFTVQEGTTVGNSYAMGERSSWMGLAGLGADWRLSPRFALRLEVNDRIYKPEIYAAQAYVGTGNVTLTAGDDNVSQTVHEIAGQLGLHMLFGLARPEIVAVAPAPLPPPPPPAEAPPAPREEAVSVCVIDPTAPGGIRMQNATFLVASGDTVVTVNGNRVPLAQAVGTIQTARNADWYVRGEPLTLTVGQHKIQYLTYQGATQIPMDQLYFLGTVNGYPVYANKAETADLQADLDELRKARQSNDLADILDERNDVRGELEDIKLLYVPLESTGCVFQTVQMLEQVRKGK